jgi:hypothetical protein
MVPARIMGAWLGAVYSRAADCIAELNLHPSASAFEKQRR